MNKRFIQCLILALPYAVLAFVLSLASLIIIKSHGMPPRGIDDANIFIVYADNFIQGHGIVYNIGGERVEGFSSLAWFGLLSAILALGLPVPVIYLVSLILTFFSVSIYIYIIGRELKIDRREKLSLQLIYVMLIATHYNYVAWHVVTMMDVTLWGFMLAVVVICLRPSKKYDGREVFKLLSITTLPFVRSEGFLISIILLIAYQVNIYLNFRRWNRQSIITGGIFYVMCVLGLTTWRMIYFGYPFPNTYYAKVSPNMMFNLKQGAAYAWNYLVDFKVFFAVFIYLIGFILFVIKRAKDELISSRFTLLLLLWSLIASIIVMTGGDHFPLYRFFQASFPMICCLLICSVGMVYKVPFFRYAAILLLFVFLSLNVVTFIHAFRDKPLKYEYFLANVGFEISHILETVMHDEASKPLVGVFTAGGTKRAYQGEVIDLLGLNSTHIAHKKGERKGLKNHAAFDKDMFFDFSPDIVLAVLPQAKKQNFYTNVTKDLFETRQFQEKYTYGILVKDRFQILGFYKKTYLNHLLRQPAGFYFKVSNDWRDRWITPN